MPWSGTGTYTRGYASWTSDASNNLPISATKFDTEDNDFAAGIQNCLTIDGQSKPNATLTWAQALALTKGTDSTVFSIARTGGTNNPSLTWSLADGANSVTATLATGNPAVVFTPVLYSFGNPTDNPSYVFKGSGTATFGGATSLETAVGALNVANASVATFSLTCTGAAANQKLWDFNADTGGLLHARLVNDADNSANDWLTVTRTGVASAVAAFVNSTLTITDNAASPTSFNAGYMDCPQVVHGTNYTLLLSDRGKQMSVSANNIVFTIPANSVTAFPVGTVIVITSGSFTGCTIAINTDTLNLAGTATTGTRSLSAWALVAITKIGSTNWVVSGAGVS